MMQTARSRYLLAAPLWAGAVAWLALDPTVRGVYPLMLALAAVTATICGAIVERDERAQQTIRLTWWASACAHASVPGQRQEAAADAVAALGDPK